MPILRRLALPLLLVILSVVACLPDGRQRGDDDDDDADCFTDLDCSEGQEYCKADDPSSSPEGICQDLEAAGDPCTLGSQCVSELFCLVDNQNNAGQCQAAPSSCQDGPACNCEPMLELCAPGGLSCDGSGDSVTLHCYNGAGGGSGDDDTGDDDDATGGSAGGTVPCATGSGTATVDVWQVTGAGTLRVDTTSASTTFDPVAWFSADASGTYSPDNPSGDDEFECSFPPPTYSCPQVDAPGAGFLAVAAYTEDCNSSGVGSYSVSGPLGSQVADDIVITIEE